MKAKNAPPSLATAPPVPRHRVQFFVDDGLLLTQVARFLAEGGRPAVAVASRAHIEGLRARLPRDVAVRYLDAESTLDSLYRDGRLDARRFEAVIGTTVRELAAATPGHPVRAFGEMVSILTARGRPRDAVALERMWNALADEIPLALLCAYPLTAFPGALGAGDLQAVCDEHDHVAPAGERLGEDDERRRSTGLQQHVQTLRTQVDFLQARSEAIGLEDDLLDFIQNGPVGMHQVDGDGKILWVNRFELDLLGYERDEFVGRDIRDFHADSAVVDGIFESIRNGNVVAAQRSLLRRKDGSFQSVLISSNGRVQDGHLVRSRCIVRPIDDLVAEESARRASESLLLQRERQQATVARLGHLALQELGLDQLFQLAMREVTQTLEADTSGLLQLLPGTTDLQFRAGAGFPPDFTPRVPGGPGTHSHFVLAAGRAVVYADLPAEARFAPAPLLLEQGIVSGMSVVIPVRDGVWGTIGVHSRRPRHFSQDDINFLEACAHILGAAIDRRHDQEELQRSRDHLEAIVRERTQRLEQANRELDAFTSAVSHDLRGPVRAIAGFSALMAQRHAGRLDPHGRELLEEVRRAASRMGDLIEDLLDLSRADRLQPRGDPVDLSRMASEIVRAEAERQPERHVHCDVAPDILVQGDADLLRMALENLLSNAWKFTSRTKDARISVSKRREGEEVVVCVQDNGAGFDMADAGRLFQPFQRLHRRSEYDGTGIGLATVRRIIERHGGRVWAQGKPGVGAAFYFTLPTGGPEA